MKSKKFFLFNILIALIVASSVAVLFNKGFLDRFQLAGLDMLFRVRGPLPYHPKIVIIEVDDADIEKVGRWPWKRVWHAAIIRALNDFGAKEIYFDIIFSERSNANDDRFMAQALREASNVYLPFVFPEGTTSIAQALLPIDEFAASARGTGAINIYPDIDGALRKIPLFFLDKDKIHYHMALRIAMDYLGVNIKSIQSRFLVLSGNGKDIKIPLVEENKMIINWLGKWKQTFKHFSFLEVLNAYQETQEGKTPSIDITEFKDSICIIAVTAIGLYDIKPIPLEFAYPGIGITTTAMSNILDRDFIKTVSFTFVLFCVFLFALIPSLLISGEKPLRETLSTISVAFLFFVVSFLFFRKNIWLDLSLPLLSLFVSYLAVSSYNFIRVSVERKSFLKLAVTDELTGLFNIRYFMMILINECTMARAEPTKQFCVIMADIDRFKDFNDHHGHQIGDFILSKVADILKISVRSSDVVARYGGEEMILLLRGTNLDGGMIVAEKIRKNVEEYSFKDKDFVYRVTLSVGLSSFHYDDDHETIIKRADDALYEAKRSGRNKVASIARQ